MVHDMYDNTWKCGELKLYFSPSAGGLKKNKKKKTIYLYPIYHVSYVRETHLQHTGGTSYHTGSIYQVPGMHTRGVLYQRQKAWPKCKWHQPVLSWYYICIGSCKTFFWRAVPGPGGGVLALSAARRKQGAHRYITTHVSIPAELRGGALSIQRR